MLIILLRLQTNSRIRFFKIGTQFWFKWGLNREHQQQNWGGKWIKNTTFLKKHSHYSGPMSYVGSVQLGEEKYLPEICSALHPWLPTNSVWMMKLPKLLFREGAQRVFLWIHPSPGLSRRSLQNGSYKEGRAERGLFSRDCRPRTSHGHKRCLADYKPLMRSEGEVYGGTHRHRIRRQ